MEMKDFLFNKIIKKIHEEKEVKKIYYDIKSDKEKIKNYLIHTKKHIIFSSLYDFLFNLIELMFHIQTFEFISNTALKICKGVENEVIKQIIKNDDENEIFNFKKEILISFLNKKNIKLNDDEINKVIKENTISDYFVKTTYTMFLRRQKMYLFNSYLLEYFDYINNFFDKKYDEINE